MRVEEPLSRRRSRRQERTEQRKMAEQDDARSEFRRHRKPVMALAALAILYDLAGLHLSEVNVLGTKIVVEHPEALEAGLWAALLYYTVLARMFLSRTEGGRVADLVMPWLEPKLRVLVEQDLRHRAIDGVTGQPARVLPEFKAVGPFYDLQVEYSATNQLNPGGTPVEHRVRVGYTRSVTLYLRAYLGVLFRTPRILEEEFPFVLVALAIAHEAWAQTFWLVGAFRAYVLVS